MDETIPENNCDHGSGHHDNGDHDNGSLSLPSSPSISNSMGYSMSNYQENGNFQLHKNTSHGKQLQQQQQLENVQQQKQSKMFHRKIYTHFMLMYQGKNIKHKTGFHVYKDALDSHSEVEFIYPYKEKKSYYKQVSQTLIGQTKMPLRQVMDICTEVTKRFSFIGANSSSSNDDQSESCNKWCHEVISQLSIDFDSPTTTNSDNEKKDETQSSSFIFICEVKSSLKNKVFVSSYGGSCLIE
ncbi:hypothetical protein CYY_007861 [Polysphondylium violaceum]|uniref:Uncharacterized protein n=1 Tax=Polysphondylium violaceum TaxID=133409 RepID=A0A8J4V4J9_9MYCE|nr:hypothetical protein CYY_007861 [Polysphondylium violaceum]